MKKERYIDKKTGLCFLKKIWMRIFFGSSLFYLAIYSIIFFNFKQSIHPFSFYIIGLAFTFPLILIHNIASLSLLLIFFDVIRRKNIFSFLAFYFTSILLLIIELNDFIKQEHKDFFYVYIVIAFFFCLTIGYIYFLINKKKFFND